jgi:alpha-tubulin suppressor-like RCC1 family protein
LTEDGVLFTWETGEAENAYPTGPVSELGYGRFVHDFGAPHRVLAFEGVRIASVAVGTWFTVAVTEAGAVSSFGMGDGRLGHGIGGADVGVFLPKRIEALDGIHVVTVAADRFHALALTRCGRVYSWGAWYNDCDIMVLGLGSDIDDDVSWLAGSGEGTRAQHRGCIGRRCGYFKSK